MRKLKTQAKLCITFLGCKDIKWETWNFNSCVEYCMGRTTEDVKQPDPGLGYNSITTSDVTPDKLNSLSLRFPYK